MWTIKKSDITNGVMLIEDFGDEELITSTSFLGGDIVKVSLDDGSSRHLDIQEFQGSPIGIERDVTASKFVLTLENLLGGACLLPNVDGPAASKKQVPTSTNADTKIGIFDIPFGNLNFASEEYRLREKNKARVNYLAKILLARKESRLTSMLTVLPSPEQTYKEDDDLCKKQFIVLDGNHRLAAMTKVREITGDPSAFKHVTCHVYKNLSTTEALVKGYCTNDVSSDALKTSDYDKVILVRKLWNEHQFKELDGKERMAKLYTVLKSDAREKKQKLQPCMFVGRLNAEQFQIVEPALRNGICKASTFNMLRPLSDPDRMIALTKYKEQGYCREALLQCCMGKKKKEKTKTAPVIISAFEEGIQFKHGSKVLHSPIIEAFGVTMDASVFEQLIKDNLPSTNVIESNERHNSDSLGFTSTADVQQINETHQTATMNPKQKGSDTIEIPKVSDEETLRIEANYSPRRLDTSVFDYSSPEKDDKRRKRTKPHTQSADPNPERSNNIDTSEDTDKGSSSTGKEEKRRKRNTPESKTMDSTQESSKEINELNDTEYLFHPTPMVVKVGDYIVMKINEKCSEEEKKMPWIGVVTKHSPQKVWFDWVIVQNMTLKTGIAQPAKDSTSRKNIIGKFSTGGETNMSTRFLNLLKWASGINI